MKVSLAALLAAALTSCPALAQGASDSSQVVPRLNAGAIDLGFGGALTVVEGSTTGLASVRLARFSSSPIGLLAPGIEVSLAHRNSLNMLDLLLSLTWQTRLASSSSYPFIAITGGLRQEWLGSFTQPRYPAGIGLGLLTLIGKQIGFRTEYRFQRVLGDPVANFSEHLVIVRMSFFWGNEK